MGKETYTRDKSGHVVGKDTTINYKDGCSKVIHQEASTNCLGVTSAGRITGVTQNHHNGTSKHTKK